MIILVPFQPTRDSSCLFSIYFCLFKLKWWLHWWWMILIHRSCHSLWLSSWPDWFCLFLTFWTLIFSTLSELEAAGHSINLAQRLKSPFYQSNNHQWKFSEPPNPIITKLSNFWTFFWIRCRPQSYSMTKIGH
jgi:hypothetical protein